MVAGKPQHMHLTENSHTWTASKLKSSRGDDLLISRQEGYEIVVFNGEGELTGNRDSEECYCEQDGENVNSKSFNNSHRDSTNRATKGILGDTDTRIPLESISNTPPPYKAVVYIDYACTGFFVGPKHILTAGHCVYNYRRRGFYEKSYVYQAKECTNEPCDEDRDDCFQMKTYIIFRKYYTHCSRSYDIAMIIVDKESKEWLDLGWKTDSESMEGMDISVSGYPSEKRDHCMYVGFGQIKKDLKFEVTHNADTTSGMSGGPIYNVWDGLVYGVNTAYDPSEHLNTGVKITKRLYKTIQHWMDQYH